MSKPKPQAAGWISGRPSHQPALLPPPGTQRDYTRWVHSWTVAGLWLWTPGGQARVTGGCSGGSFGYDANAVVLADLVALLVV
jgi:hypothetical protein